MHISYKNRLLWQIKVTHPLVAIIYSRFTYPWRFTRVHSVIVLHIGNTGSYNVQIARKPTSPVFAVNMQNTT